ncbi:hypothetical protein HRbin02_01036 [Candidatus Calditenuaceae archaeon HR02]|nr:hypothetical protein HRbin02_01036 [Candidatus Calditenuaceae archaeon HR02]
MADVLRGDMEAGGYTGPATVIKPEAGMTHGFKRTGIFASHVQHINNRPRLGFLDVVGMVVRRLTLPSFHCLSV